MSNNMLCLSYIYITCKCAHFSGKICKSNNGMVDSGCLPGPGKKFHNIIMCSHMYMKQNGHAPWYQKVITHHPPSMRLRYHNVITFACCHNWFFFWNICFNHIDTQLKWPDKDLKRLNNISAVTRTHSHNASLSILNNNGTVRQWQRRILWQSKLSTHKFRHPV